MFFTQEDYKKIENYLKRNSVKDTEFQNSLPINGREEIPIIQDGKNTKIRITNLFEFISEFADNIINLNSIEDSPMTIEHAISIVKKPQRIPGIFITFIDQDNQWAIYQFIGKSVNYWSNLENWRNVFEKAKNPFKGFFVSKDILLKREPYPSIGDFAYVGAHYAVSTIFRCVERGKWNATNEHVPNTSIDSNFGYREDTTISQKAITQRFEKIEAIIKDKIESIEI